jgi:cysteinyl-tRNA synthetase
MKLADVTSWGYQLQNIKPAKVAASPYDLMVVDYADDDGRPFSRDQVAAMQRKPDGAQRLVLAYFSIGEAEDYRPYWRKEWRKSRPAWLGKENPEWKGNFLVSYWAPEWQQILAADLDRIVAAGFDGAYLDRVDSFEDWEARGDKAAAGKMVDLVASLSAHAKAKRPGFLIVSQNGDGLLDRPGFRAAIDGFAREDLFYGEDDDRRRNSRQSIGESIAQLKRFAAEGKPVFVVEYPSRKDAESVRDEIKTQGFTGLVAGRELDRLP